MSECYLCDLCRHSEYIASNTRLKCHGESGAIVNMKVIDVGEESKFSERMAKLGVVSEC